MKTIKIIDLLNKISNGNIPKKIRFLNHYYIWKENDEDYQKEDGLMLFENCKINYILNTEVEIIEENTNPIPLPSKIGLNDELYDITNKDDMNLIIYSIHKSLVEFKLQYNRLIDYLESKEKGENDDE